MIKERIEQAVNVSLYAAGAVGVSVQYPSLEMGQLNVIPSIPLLAYLGAVLGTRAIYRTLRKDKVLENGTGQNAEGFGEK